MISCLNNMEAHDQFYVDPAPGKTSFRVAGLGVAAHRVVVAIFSARLIFGLLGTTGPGAFSFGRSFLKTQMENSIRRAS